MQSSSLIFVVVVAIWAAYLVQYWVRRRDHLATIRSVDRFSAAMRVLDSHRLSQTAEPARSYAVSPARPASPQVVVKRAAPAPEVPMSTSHLEHEPERPGGTGRLGVVAAVVDAPRRVRGLALLAHLVLLPVALLLAAFGPLSWIVPLLLLVGLLGAFGWLRQDVKAAEAARRDAARARRREREATRAAAPAPARAASRRSAPARTGSTAVDGYDGHETYQTYRSDESDAAEHEIAEISADELHEATTVTAEAPFDLDAQGSTGSTAVSAPAAEAVGAAVAEDADETLTDDRDGTWEPVPVPRPTYTMKARAEARDLPAPSADAPQVLDAVDDDIVAPERRAVGS